MSFLVNIIKEIKFYPYWKINSNSYFREVDSNIQNDRIKSKNSNSVKEKQLYGPSMGF